MEENNNNNDDVMASVHSTVFKESESLEGKCIKIEGYDFNQGVNYSQLLKSMVSTGFQASNFGDAIQVVNQMLDWSLADEVITDDCDEEERESKYRKSVRCKVFLGFTSNLISSGVRDTVRYLVQHHMVDVVVTTAGGIEEDLVKCLAPTFKGDFALPGAYLRSKGLNRIGNLLVPNDNYCKFEDWIIPIFDQMLKEQNEEKVSWTPSKVIARLGKEINDESSYLYWAYKEHHVRTGCASVSVIIYGDQDKPALITYPDLALNHMSCFQGLFFWPEAASMLLHNFCIYHICPPGHELGAAPIRLDDHVPSVDDLADQILEVLNYFGLDAVMCMGVTAGAYILTLFAMKYRERVIGLILVSPVCKSPSWSEWFYNKVMSNLLYFYGMCGLLKEFLIQRYFSKEVRGTAEVPESDIVQACRRLLDERQSINVLRFLQAINRRPDITDGLKRLRCRTLVFVGDSSPFHSEALHMISKLDKRYSALVEVQACGSMVTEEQPHAMLIPMEYFFMGYGLYRPCLFSNRSPLSLSCISPELLSPESMGLNLKPIKTRVAFSV